jgi:hypothetical protein
MGGYWAICLIHFYHFLYILTVVSQLHKDIVVTSTTGYLEDLATNRTEELPPSNATVDCRLFTLVNVANGVAMLVTTCCFFTALLPSHRLPPLSRHLLFALWVSSYLVFSLIIYVHVVAMANQAKQQVYAYSNFLPDWFLNLENSKYAEVIATATYSSLIANALLVYTCIYLPPIVQGN